MSGDTGGDPAMWPDRRAYEAAPVFLRNQARNDRDRLWTEPYTYLCDTGPDGVGAAMPVYCVRFEPSDLWPDNAEKNFSLYADLYARYVEAPETAEASKAA